MKKRANFVKLFLIEQDCQKEKSCVGLLLENSTNEDNELINNQCQNLQAEKLLKDFGYIAVRKCWVFEEKTFSDPFLIQVKALLIKLGFETREAQKFIMVEYLY